MNRAPAPVPLGEQYGNNPGRVYLAWSEMDRDVQGDGSRGVTLGSGNGAGESDTRNISTGCRYVNGGGYAHNLSGEFVASRNLWSL